MSYVIGSFNIQKLNLVSTEETKKNFARIAQIIKDERFDAIAIQEVCSKSALERIRGYLGPSWDAEYRETNKTLGNSSAQLEGYAFIWNNKRLRLVKGPEGDTAPSSVQRMDGYSISRDSTGAFIHKGSLVRPPMVVRLTPSGLPGGAPFELRLINTHIAFNSPSICADKYGQKELRLMEFETLAKEIYRKVSMKRYGTNKPSYTVLMGDYNLCLAGESGMNVPEFTCFAENRTLRTVQRDKTFLKQVQEPYSYQNLNEEHDSDTMDESDTDIYSQNYDHFSYDTDYEANQGVSFLAARVEPLANTRESLEQYRKEVSDHVPIKLVVELKSGIRSLSWSTHKNS